MKKNYENPIIDVMELDVVDIITTSGQGTGLETDPDSETDINPGDSWWG